MNFAIQTLVKPKFRAKGQGTPVNLIPRKSDLQPRLLAVMPRCIDNALTLEELGRLCNLTPVQVSNTLYRLKKKGSIVNRKLTGAGVHSYWVEE